MRVSGRVDRIVFNGIIFRRYPDAPGRSERCYYVPAGNHRKRGVGRLHEEIWKAANGPIPDGHHVHHRDGDTLNNDLANLELLPGADHLREHSAPGELPAGFANSRALATERATEWHRSAEGHEWHVEHGKRTWEERQPRKSTCEQCDIQFDDITLRARFCSNKCKTASRLASGIDDEQRICEGCGQPFTINRYRAAKCCSRKCAWVVRRRR